MESPDHPFPNRACKPEVLVMPGRVAVFMGSAYQYMTPARAERLRDDLTAALQKLGHREDNMTDAMARSRGLL